MAEPRRGDMPGDPSLAALWEMEPSIRVASCESACLTKWANTRLIGVASTGAMSLNIKVLELLAEWWAKQVDMPQAIPIDKLRDQVGQQKLFGPNSILVLAGSPGPIQFQFRKVILVKT